MNSKTTVKGHAKLNLFLDITGRLENGYHSINSVMQSIDLADVVTVELTDAEGEYRIYCDNPSIPCDERNIAYRACRLFSGKTGIRFGADINIEKHIPAEAGMGGSSADGAAVLTALNDMFGVYGREKLCLIGSEIGADVPFCIHKGTCICRGTGEIITPIKPLSDSVFVVVQPDFTCSTAEAYKIYDRSPLHARTEEFERFVKAVDSGSLTEACGGMYNIFEKLYADPAVENVKAGFIANGALAAVLTGSGSAVFGVFDGYEKAENALNKLCFPWKCIAKCV